MKFISLIILLLLSNATSWAEEYLILESTNGSSIRAKPILLNQNQLSIERNDGRRFTINLSTLSNTSQELVLTKLNQTPEPKTSAKRPGAPKAASGIKGTEEPTPEEIEYKQGSKMISKLYYQDTNNLFKKVSDYPEMDITGITFEKKSGGRVKIELTFLDDLHSKQKDEMPYRIWLALDLDDDLKTGLDQQRGMGEDIAIALNGFSTQTDWKYYTVPKSEIGRESKIKVEDIRAKGNALSFILSSNTLRSSAVYRMNFTTSATLGVGTLDSFPDHYGLRIAFDESKITEGR